MLRPLFIIGRRELMANKRASGREKDLRDVAMLQALSSPSPRPRRTALRRRVHKPRS
jgi:hypothetical protein